MQFLKAIILATLIAAPAVATADTQNSLTVALEGEFSPWLDFNAETSQAVAEAVATYQTTCARWRDDVHRQLGSTLKYLECGPRHDSRVGPTLLLRQTDTYLRSLIGNVSSSVGTILVNTPRGLALKNLDRTIHGEAFEFDLSNYESVSRAFRNAKESYQKTCQAWQTEVAADFDDSFVFATCGALIDGEIPYLSDSPQDAWRSKFELSSEGKIFYFEAENQP